MATFSYITFNGRKISLIAEDHYKALEQARKIAYDWGTLLNRRTK